MLQNSAREESSINILRYTYNLLYRLVINPIWSCKSNSLGHNDQSKVLFSFQASLEIYL